MTNRSTNRPTKQGAELHSTRLKRNNIAIYKDVFVLTEWRRWAIMQHPWVWSIQCLSQSHSFSYKLESSWFLQVWKITLSWLSWYYHILINRSILVCQWLCCFFSIPYHLTTDGDIHWMNISIIRITLMTEVRLVRIENLT